MLFNYLECDYILNGNFFYNNTATTMGGALHYDLYSPIGLLNNTFLSN